MAEVNLRSWSEISEAADNLQLNPTNVMLEEILATMARLESKLDERNRRLGTTIPPPRPEPDPPDGPLLYAATTQPYQPYTPQPNTPQPYFPNQSPPTHNIYQQLPSPLYQPYAMFDASCIAFEPPSYQPYATFDAACITFVSPPYIAPDTYAGYHTGQREYQPTPPPYQPQGPSCWDPPTLAFEQPYFYMDSHDQPHNSLVEDHQWKPEYEPLQPISPSPQTHHSSTAQLLVAASPPPPATIFSPCSPDKIYTLSIMSVAAAAPSDESLPPLLAAAVPPPPQPCPPSCGRPLPATDKNINWDDVPSQVVVPSSGDVASIDHHSTALEADARLILPRHETPVPLLRASSSLLQVSSAVWDFLMTK